MSTLDLGTLYVRYKGDREGLKRELHDAEGETKRSGDRMGRGLLESMMAWLRDLVARWRSAGVQAADGFWRDANGRLHDQRGRFVAEGAALGAALGGGASSGLGLFSTALQGLGDAIGSANFDMGSLVKWAVAAAAALTALAPAVHLVGGALGALPALTTGGIAAIATLGLGFIGLGDAFKKTNAAGGSVVDRLRQIALAERRVAEANKEVTASQEALNRARKTAAERMEDLNANLATARLDVEDAEDAVEQARRNLERARQGGNASQIDRAAREYQRAEIALERLKDRVDDLSQEQEEANRKGIEGSDEVEAALERQRRAYERLEDAAYDLKRAQRPTGGGVADEVTKIAASAAAAVATIKSLKGESESLRLDIQERLFSGVDVELKTLWASWLPTLRERLGSMATMFNGLFKDWAKTSRKPEFISNIAAGWQGVEALIQRVGRAIAGPGLEAFGKLSRAARPMLDAIGDSVGRAIESFSAWIDKAEKSGALQEFFEDAGQFFRDTASVGGSVVRIIGSLIGIFMRGTERSREAQVKGFVEKMDELADWFEDPKNQEKIDGFFKTLQDIQMWVMTEAIPTVGRWIEKFGEWADKIQGWVDKAKAFKDGVVESMKVATASILALPLSVASGLLNMWEPIKNGFRAAINWVIEKWNALELPSLTVGGVTISPPISTRDIPKLGDGGLVRARQGGHVVNVAEAGQDEIVSPVEQMRRIVAEELARVHAEGGRSPRVIEIPIYIGDEVVRVVRYELTEHDRQSKRFEDAGRRTF